MTVDATYVVAGNGQGEAASGSAPAAIAIETPIDRLAEVRAMAA